ncbi:hypothetical protein [Streptomyces sp. NPDC050982]|uniref:hypothetical protein n=1 Tax=Streptomyces sp. NPDC050982 TaxID=3154746 RepID=UPI003407834D
MPVITVEFTAQEMAQVEASAASLGRTTGAYAHDVIMADARRTASPEACPPSRTPSSNVPEEPRRTG